MEQPSTLSRMMAPLGRLFSFGGRSRRADHWPFMGLLIGIYFVGFVLAIIAIPFGMGSPIAQLYLLTAFLALLALASTVRRLHDVGWSSWWVVSYVAMLIAFIALFFYWRYGVVHQRYGPPSPSLMPVMPLMMLLTLVMNGIGLLVFILSLLDGTPGPNRYGPDPKGRSAP